MKVLRDPKQLTQQRESKSTTTAFIVTVLADSIKQHFQALGELDNYDAEQHGYIVIVEPNDTIALLEQETGCPILTDWFQDSRYGDEDFAPAYEWLDEQAFCYVMGFTLNDDGFTMLLIVPKLSGVDSQLLKMCQENAGTNTA
jgi:hypothetical protein